MSDAITDGVGLALGQAFLGEDLMHTCEYLEDTCNVIDEEVERILRTPRSGGAMDVLSATACGLNAIARALLDNEIIDGAEVGRLVDEAHGSPVHTEGAKSVPNFTAAVVNGRANGHGNGAAPEPATAVVKSPSAGTGSGTAQSPGAGPSESPSSESLGGPSDNWPPPPWPPADPAEAPPLAPPPEDAAPR